MKKILVMVLGALFLMTSAVTAQGFVTSRSEYSPYVNLGSTISSNVNSFGLEAGAQNNVSRYAVTAGFTNRGDRDDNDTWTAGAIGYWKIANRRTENKVDVFATGAAKLDLDRYHAVTLSPGLAATFNLWESFAPQLSVAFPIRENSVLRERPLGVELGLSVNIQ